MRRCYIREHEKKYILSRVNKMHGIFKDISYIKINNPTIKHSFSQHNIDFKLAHGALIDCLGLNYESEPIHRSGSNHLNQINKIWYNLHHDEEFRWEKAILIRTQKKMTMKEKVIFFFKKGWKYYWIRLMDRSTELIFDKGIKF